MADSTPFLSIKNVKKNYNVGSPSQVNALEVAFARKNQTLIQI
jgi:hypothetical protein